MITTSSNLKRKRSSSIECLRDSLKEGPHLNHGYLAFGNPILPTKDKKQKGQVLQIKIPVALNSGLPNHEEQRSSSTSLFSAYWQENSDVLKERQGIEVCIGIVGSKGHVFIRNDLGRAGISKISFHLPLVAI
jgi:hypothetical protein